MCDCLFLASPLFRRLAGRGAIFCGFPFRWVLHFVFYLTRRVALHESPSCSREDSVDEYGRPCSSVASMQPILIGTGDPVSKGSGPRMFSDVPVQRCHMPTSGTHVLGLAFSKQRNSEFKLKYLKRLLDNNIICLQEVHGKDEFLQAIQVLAPRFRLFGTFLPDNENAGGSAICIHRDLLLEDAIASHVITCPGRDHLVNIRSGRHNLVIVNIHFEPELTLRQLRGRLRLIHPHWPAYPNGVGVILGDFSICDREEGRFNYWNRSFTDGDPGKTAVFHSFFPYVLEVANTTLQYASSFRNLQIEDTRANVFPAGCPNIPFSVPYCSSFMTTTDSPLTNFVHLQNLKFSYTRPRR